MSSHHVVRDDQEPSLLILQAFEGIDHLLSQLLEWSPIVITSRALSDLFVHRNIKLDVVLNTQDDPPMELDGQLQTVRQHTVGPGQSLLNAALDYLAGRQIRSLNIVDHWSWEKAEICETYHLDVVYYFDKDKYSLIRNKAFKKWTRSGETFTIPKGELTQYSGVEMEGSGFVNNDSGMVCFEGRYPFWVQEVIFD